MVRGVDRNRWPLFLAKAEEFLRGATQSRDGGDWNASFSSAVHAGILACDVVTVGILGIRNTGEHDEAVRLLARAFPKPPRELADLRRRVARLLQVKNLAEYEERSVDRRDAEACLKDASRLLEFARAQSKLF